MPAVGIVLAASIASHQTATKKRRTHASLSRVAGVGAAGWVIGRNKEFIGWVYPYVLARANTATAAGRIIRRVMIWIIGRIA